MSSRLTQLLISNLIYWASAFVYIFDELQLLKTNKPPSPYKLFYWNVSDLLHFNFFLFNLFSTSVTTLLWKQEYTCICTLNFISFCLFLLHRLSIFLCISLAVQLLMDQDFLFCLCVLFKKSLKKLLAESITALISIRKWFLMLCNRAWYLKASDKVIWTLNKLWEHIQLIFLSYSCCQVFVICLQNEKGLKGFLKAVLNIWQKKCMFHLNEKVWQYALPLKFLLEKLAKPVINTNQQLLTYPVSREPF